MSYTLAQVAVEFLDLHQYSKLTQKSYLSTLQPLLRFCGSQAIAQITSQDLEDYLITLKHLAPKTQQRHRTTIGSLFNYGVQQRYLVYNPLTCLPKPKDRPSHHESITYLNPEQLQVLYHALEQDRTQIGDRLHAIVRLLHRTGAKVSEILALDLDRVDLERRQFQLGDRRSCFYSEDVVPVLERYIRYSRIQSAHCPAVFTASDRQSKGINRLSYSILYQNWQKLIQTHPDLSSAHLNDLRHTFALERVGLMGIEELQGLMGHKDIHMTLRYKYFISPL